MVFQKGRVLAQDGLKDRKSRMLSEDDIDHYRKIIAALAETRRLMAEIDDVIEQYGDWPDAFKVGETESRSAGGSAVTRVRLRIP